MTGAVLALLLSAAAPWASPAAGAGLPPAAATPPSAGVAPSTAAVVVSPADIPELRRQIEQDQKEVLRRRSALRKAERGGGEAAKAKARENWLQARDKLKSDRALLKRAIELSEAERAGQVRPGPEPVQTGLPRQPRPKNVKLKP
ncbi:MAG: hypothetical protein NTX64_12350 [Elusimicrobia bacterium]|nr:hypothetical protein [Elusimicrobiota bacterium]